MTTKDSPLPNVFRGPGVRQYLAGVAPIAGKEDLASTRSRVRKGDEAAILRLAVCYGDGRGVARDTNKAERLLSKLGSSSNPYAHFFLAQLNAFRAEKQKSDPPKDRYKKQRFEQLRQAQDLGLPESLYEFALIERSTRTRKELLEQAMRLGAAEASFYLGLKAFEKGCTLVDGQPVCSSGVAAREYLLHAANEGLPKAQSYLARLYSGICRDIIENRREQEKWLLKASSGDFFAWARLIELLESRGTPSSLQRAIDLIRRPPLAGDSMFSPTVPKERFGPAILQPDEERVRAKLGDKEAIVAYAIRSGDRDWLEKGAELGDIDCERRCAEMELQQPSSQIAALDALAEEDSSEATSQYWLMRKTAGARMLALAERGDAEAMRLYAERLDGDENCETWELDEAAQWRFKAFSAGAYPDKYFLLGEWPIHVNHYSELLDQFIHHPRFDNDPEILRAYGITLEYGGGNVEVNIEKAGDYYLRAAHYGNPVEQRQWYLYLLRTSLISLVDAMEDSEDSSITMPSLYSWEGWNIEHLIKEPTPLTLVALVNPDTESRAQLATSFADRIFDSLRRTEDMDSISGDLFFECNYATSYVFHEELGRALSSVREYRPLLDALEKTLPAPLGDADTLQSRWKDCWPIGYLLGVCAFDFQDDQPTFQRWVSYLNHAENNSPFACALLGYLHQSGKIHNANMDRSRKCFEKVKDWEKETKNRISESQKEMFSETLGWTMGLLLAVRESQVREQTTQEMLSYLTHTMKNLFASSPEQARQVMATLGSQMYEGRKSEHMAILNAGRMYSTFIYAQHLASTFKLYIAESGLLREKWRTDNSGNATVQGVLAFALNECLSQLIFQTDYQNALEDLLPANVEAKKQVRRSFTEEIIPLAFDEANTKILIQWIERHIPRLRIDVKPELDARFAANGTRYAFLFSCFAELITNSFKYVAVQGDILISWRRDETSFVFSVANHRSASNDSGGRIAGSGRGLDFVRRAAQAVGAHLDTDFTSDPCEAKLVMPISMWEN